MKASGLGEFLGSEDEEFHEHMRAYLLWVGEEEMQRGWPPSGTKGIWGGGVGRLSMEFLGSMALNSLTDGL